MKTWIATLLILSTSQVLAGEAYRTENPDGTVEFSDVPASDSAPIHITPPSTFSGSTPHATSGSGAGDDGQADGGPDYSGFAITSPVVDQVITAANGAVPVSLAVPAELEEGLEVVVFLDGREAARGRGSSYTLSNVDRGTHNVSAAIVDGSNVVVASTLSITFHLHRHSILH